MNKISYIISCYDRPMALMCCLASLYQQTHRAMEVIVVDNNPDPQARMLNLQAFNSVRRGESQYLATLKPTCYHSSEIGAALANGDWLCFPSDDSYYVPVFAERLLEQSANADLLYCDMVFNSRYRVVDTRPAYGYIDKTGFLLRRHLFRGFPGKPETDIPAGCDGYLVESIVQQGHRVVKHNEVLAVHN